MHGNPDKNMQFMSAQPMTRRISDIYVTLSILLPTSIVTISCFVECVSSSLIHWSSFINDCLLDTSYTGNTHASANRIWRCQ